MEKVSNVLCGSDSGWLGLEEEKVKYIGKLILEGIVVTLIVGVVLFAIIYAFGDKIMELLGGLR